LLSKRWFASGWCRREFELALRLGKRVFGVVIDATRTEDIPPEYRDTWQLTRLSGGQDGQLFPVRLPPDGVEAHVVFSREGLQRLRRGLQSAGLDPRHFDWPPPNDPDRPPYRGLRPLEAADAGIFFGREAPLIDALDQLRGLRDRAAPRLFVVLGASGAGKSSFLRAGLLPRLARDDRHWRALPPIRPQGAVLDGEQGLVAALHRAFIELGRPRARPALAIAANTPDGLMALLAELTAAATPPTLPGEAPAVPPTILLAVDQAEELFQADGAAQSRAFLELLAAIAQAETPGVLVLFTIRTDLYGPLQEAAALAGLRQQTFPLPPLHPTSYPTIIEGPARRLEGPRALAVPAKLTQDLAGVAAAGGGDALPLLAFTLETLWHDHGATGRLAPEGYDASAGFAEAISAAVLRAITAAVRAGVAPAEEAARLALLRRGLIPWLAGIDPATNAPRRRRARLSDIPAEARGLIEHLVEARLLSADTNAAGEPVLEPAHDALLRRWGVLHGWLEEDAALLAALEAVQEAARDWDANARDAAWLAHRAGRLESAEALRARDDLWAGLGTAERAYLGACRAAEDAARDRELAAARELAETERRGRKRAMVGLAAASLAALVAIGAGGWAWHQQGVAEQQRTRAETGFAAARDAANSLVFELAAGLRNREGMPASLVRDLLDRAGRTLDALLARTPDDPATLRLRGVAHGEFATTFATLGDTPRQRQAAEAALGIFQRLAERDPGNTQWQRDLSIRHGRMGAVLQAQGDLPGSLGAYQAGMAIRTRLAERDPGNADWQSDLSVSHVLIGDVLRAQGDLPGALRAYQAAMAIRTRLAERDP
ncbi:MAG: hypothetical protein ACK5TQ_13015, partial [Acetobacteraceae bacterium]